MNNDDIRWLSSGIARMVMITLLAIIAAGTCANNKQLDAIRKAVESQKVTTPGDPQ